MSACGPNAANGWGVCSPRNDNVLQPPDEPALIGRLGPEVTLHAQDRSDDAVARREVDARRASARAREVEHHLTRVELRLDSRVVHFEADIELRRRVPDRSQADRPGAP